MTPDRDFSHGRKGVADWCPGELWSLWDMLHFNAPRFFYVTTLLSSVETAISLLKFAGDGLQAAYTWSTIADDIESLISLLQEMGIQHSAQELSRARDALRRHFNEKPEAPEQIIAAFRRRLHDELRARQFLCLEPSMLPFYNLGGEPFGHDVAQKFPNVSEDVESAGKCLALDQPTACVFHLMRAMEAAVQALSASLQIPNPDRVWGKLLSDIHKKIELMPKGPSRDAWSAAHANLYHVKQAWRNNTMHPKQTYTLTQAKEVFETTKTFMIHLASLV